MRASCANGELITRSIPTSTPTTGTTIILEMHSNQESIEQTSMLQQETDNAAIPNDDDEDDDDDVWSERPDTATLTKGFSIPTYLPPFPDFIAADLPPPQLTAPGQTMAAASSQSSSSSSSSASAASVSSTWHPQSNEEQQQSPATQKPHMRLHAYDSEQKEMQLRREKQLQREREQLPKRQLSLPALNVTVQAGQHAYLPCQLHQHSNKPLSWVRLRDEHIIAVDYTTFINDARFATLLQTPPANSSSNTSNTRNTSIATGTNNNNNSSSNSNSNTSWTLQIKYVTLEDGGWYECQLATEPKMSAKVQLCVITPKTELIGDQQRFVKAGSKVELHCIVRGTLEAPKYIFWYRGEKQVTADNEASQQNGWYTQIDRNIFGSTEHSRNTIGTLIIPLVRKTHSGNYTCEPENSAAVSMQLHVLSGEYSASAIMSTAAHRQGHGYSSLHQWLIFLLVALNKT
ncbi:myotubularin-related protein DDB_G0290005 [Scaptodrosophila lebanonensis]|uniref:Myotubularin-related protein DDB_G0290005 n=1 Tax=Drosophila lebanonensis TaxID=7225 RepID=A0A6J2TCP5_DROLE|nr:myotubularin-related protein DDB_G0290005 [Scaptodrosophila lebanonensis]